MISRPGRCTAPAGSMRPSRRAAAHSPTAPAMRACCITPARSRSRAAIQKADAAWALARFVADGVHVRSAGQLCPTTLANAQLSEADGLALELNSACASADDGYRIELPFLTQVSIGHRHLAALHSGTAVTNV